MVEADFDQFSRLLDATCGLLSRGAYTPSSANTAMFFRALAAHPIEEVRAGFDRHVADKQRGRFVPVPADVIAQIEQHANDDGRPGSEEAWAIAVAGMDERATIVWTTETAAAWGVSRPLMQLGDEVGARMAFKEAYLRLVTMSRSINRAVKWSPALGHDVAQRDAAIERAVAAGRLPAPQVQNPLLGDDSGTGVPQGSGPVTSLAQLLERAPPHIRERLNRLRDRLTGQELVPDRPEHETPEARATNEAKAREQQKFEEHIRSIGMSVEQYMREHGKTLPWRDGDQR